MNALDIIQTARPPTQPGQLKLTLRGQLPEAQRGAPTHLQNMTARLRGQQQRPRIWRLGALVRENETKHRRLSFVIVR
jgi:hypothetical protein